jgi:hypothetical protein
MLHCDGVILFMYPSVFFCSIHISWNAIVRRSLPTAQNSVSSTAHSLETNISLSIHRIGNCYKQKLFILMWSVSYAMYQFLFSCGELWENWWNSISGSCKETKVKPTGAKMKFRRQLFMKILLRNNTKLNGKSSTSVWNEINSETLCLYRPQAPVTSVSLVFLLLFAL